MFSSLEHLLTYRQSQSRPIKSIANLQVAGYISLNAIILQLTLDGKH